jgi:hypothetical protein
MATGVAAAAIVEQACRASGGIPTSTVDVDLCEIGAQLPVRAAGALVSALAAAAIDGHRAVLRCEQPDVSLTISWSSTGRASVVLDGSARDLVPHEDVAALEGASTRGDAAAALAILPDVECNVELVLRPAGGGHWLSSAAMLAERLADGRWGSTLLRLRPASPNAPSVIVVQDAEAGLLRCPGIILAGPDVDLARLHVWPVATGASSVAYREARVLGGAAELPPPGDLLAEPAPAGGLELIRPALQDAAQALCWYWLGQNTTVTANSVTVRFEGVRTVELRLLPYGAAAARDDLALFAWATAAVDPVRDDAVQQAVTFAIRDNADLPGAAAPVLRTARSLHELAGRGAVAEALAARRGARDAAITAARAAASSARDVAAKSVERTLALLLAAALAVFANGRELLTTGAAAAVVVTAAALALLALGVADRVELESGSRLLDAFDEDLDLYREALSADDLAAIKNLAGVAAARTDLIRSRYLVRGVYGGVALMVLIGGGALIETHHANHTKQPATTTPANPRPTGTSGPTPSLRPFTSTPVPNPTAPPTHRP